MLTWPAGADGITAHLREDRRHIQDEDVRRLRELAQHCGHADILREQVLDGRM